MLRTKRILIWGLAGIALLPLILRAQERPLLQRPQLFEGPPTMRQQILRVVRSAWEMFPWGKPSPHRPYPQARTISPWEIGEIASVLLPAQIDFSSYVTLTRNQGAWGGCGAMSTLAIFDILNEKRHQYEPDSSYRFNEYFYNESSSPNVPEGYRLNQADVIQIIGSLPESEMATDYDPEISSLSVPTPGQVLLARRMMLEGYSDLIWPLTTDQLKRMLVRFGPLNAHGSFQDVNGNAYGHVFTIVGFNDATGMFKIMNSWGDNWGDGGYIFIPYSGISNPGSNWARLYIDLGIRYFQAKMYPLSYRYVARLAIHHNDARHHLVVKVGVEGQSPHVIWNHPNGTRNPDNSKNLVIDVVLPYYAGVSWPPNDTNSWYVEVSDTSSGAIGEPVGTVNEITLVERLVNPAGNVIPVLFRPSGKAFSVRRGMTNRIWVPSRKKPAVNVTIAPHTDRPSSIVEFSGSLLLKLEMDSFQHPVFPLANHVIRLYRIQNPAFIWRFKKLTGQAITDSSGHYVIQTPVLTNGNYQVIAIGPNGEIEATSPTISVLGHS